MATDVRELLGGEADTLLKHETKTIDKAHLVLPGPDYIDRVLHRERPSDRGAAQPAVDVQPRPPRRHRVPLDPPRRPGDRALGGGELREEPGLLRPGAIVELGLDADCSAVATTLGGLGISRPPLRPQDPVHRQAQPQRAAAPTRTTYDQVLFGSVRQAIDLGAVGVGATIYFGSEESTRQIREVSAMFAEAHRHGLFTVLWCYLRNPAFKTPRRPTTTSRPT